MTDWIDVNDRLPEQHNSVLVARDSDNFCPCVHEAVYISGDFYLSSSFGLLAFSNPTHWSPMPLPPVVKDL